MMRRPVLWIVAGLAAGLLLGVPGTAAAGIDHRITYDDSGIWARNNQKLFMATLLVGETGWAVWEGGQTRLGRTLWQSIDSTALGGATSFVMKKVFSRVRPIDSPDPNLWFQGSPNESFPSGEVTVTAAIVTPFVLEYGHDHPWVYGLEALPVYDAVARMKVWGHWQTDVIAGFALGTGVGYLMHRNPNKPYILRLMPNGIYVGLRY
jgi:undecaprenyl-diphosphatase